jgi:ribosomal-protein-alanine N-acetyltransferase
MIRNIRSQRVIEKCGFRFEGTMRAYVKRFGKHEDVKFYSLLHGEFANLSKILNKNKQIKGKM